MLLHWFANDGRNHQQCHFVSPQHGSQLVSLADIVPATFLTAAAGLVSSVILIVFIGVFGLFTTKLLIDLKLSYPEVHNMSKELSSYHTVIP